MRDPSTQVGRLLASTGRDSFDRLLISRCLSHRAIAQKRLRAASCLAGRIVSARSASASYSICYDLAVQPRRSPADCFRD
jgi:hypothetical protein